MSVDRQPRLGQVRLPLTIPDSAIPPGITRDSIITLLADDGVTVEERPVAIDEVVGAFDDGIMHEMFVTGTAAVVLPVGRLSFEGRDMRPSETGAGPTTRRLHDELTGIQYGRIEDRRGWTRFVEA